LQLSAKAKPSDHKKKAEEGLGILRYRQIKNKDLVKKRRAQILSAARKLFTKKGFTVTTVQDLCEESGVNPGSLYDYVKNKDDILRQLFKEMMGEDSETRAALTPDGEISDLKALRPYVRKMFRHSWAYHPDLISMAYQETRFLDEETKAEVMSADRRLIAEQAETIKQALGREVDQERLLVIASLLVYIFGFLPLKGWTVRGVDQDKVLDTTVEFFAKGLESL
jgi:AcrR family transcriptional regulator